MCKQFPFRNVCGLLTVICFWESKDTLCTTPVLSPPDYLHHSDYYHQVTMKSIHYDYYFFLQCLNNVPTIYYIPSGQSPSLTQHFFFFMIQKLFHMDMSQWGKEKTIKIFLFNSNFRVIIMLISVLLIRIRKSFIAGAVLLEDDVQCAENPE